MSDGTYTYVVKLTTNGPWVGCESEDEFPLGEYGYSDEEWDALADSQREDLLDKWAEDNFWNTGYEYNGEVTSG